VLVQAREIQWAWVQSWQECILFFLHNKRRFHAPSETTISLDDAVQHLLNLQMGQYWKGMMRASWGWDRWMGKN